MNVNKSLYTVSELLNPMKTKKLDFRKGQFNSAVATVIGLVVLGIVLVVGAAISSGVAASFTAGTTEANVSNDVLTGLDNISTNVPLLATIAIFVIILVFAVVNLRRAQQAQGA